MPGPQPAPIDLSDRQRALLERLTRQATAPQRTVTRAQIILLAAEGLNHQQIATRLGVYREMVRTWRTRWQAAQAPLAQVEAEGDEAALPPYLEALLAGAPRSGMPPVFSPEQIIDLLALACEDPQTCGHPLSHWTPSALAREVIQRQIVETISPRQVGRFLKRGRPQTPSQPLLVPSADGR